MKYPKPGVERRDLKPCEACGLPLLKRQGLQTLQAYRITIDMLMLDPRAARQYAGTMMILGGDTPFADTVANAMVGDTELLKCLSSEQAVICQPCYFDRPMAILSENIVRRREAEAKKA